MKKTSVFLLILQLFAVFSGLFAVSAKAEEFPKSDKIRSICVYNIETDTRLFEQDPDLLLPPASTVKMMTGLIACEKLSKDLEASIVVTKELLGSFTGKSISLKAGETLKIKDLLYAAICGGANDAANVLAGFLAVDNDHAEFVKDMNRRAEEYGMTNTRYANAYGFSDPDMYTTANDVVKLAAEASKNELFMKICTAVSYIIPETELRGKRYIFNSNYLITGSSPVNYRNGEAVGMSAGETTDGGTVLVTMTSGNGINNIFVLLGGTYDEEHNYIYETANSLLKWTAESFEYKRISDRSKTVREIGVDLSSGSDYVIITPERTVAYYLPKEVDLQKDVVYDIKIDSERVDAPVEAGQKLGEMTVIYNGKVLTKVDLVAKSSVDRNGFLYVMARIKSWTRSDGFKKVLLGVIGLIVLYIAVSVIARFRKKAR